MPRFVVIPRMPESVAAAAVKEPSQRADVIRIRRAGFAEGIISRLAARYAPTLHSGLQLKVGNRTLATSLEEPSLRVTKLAAINVLIVAGPAEAREFLANDEDVEFVADEEILSVPRPEGITTKAAEVPWHISATGADAAHTAGFTGRDTWIGIADTGIDASHSEFASKSVLFAEFDAGGNQVSALPRDSAQHGTHVAGIAAGRSVGIAPEASLAVALVLPKGNGTSPQVLAGLNWLVTLTRPDGKQGVEVVSLSLSVSDPAGNSVYSGAYKPVVATIRALGIEIFAAIGNSGSGTHGSPGDYRDVIGIGAIDQSDQPATWSSCAKVAQEGSIPKADFMAPGVDIYSARPQGGYRLDSGTSMATPAAAGVGALLLQQQGANANLRALIGGRAKPLPGARPCAGVPKVFF